MIERLEPNANLLVRHNRVLLSKEQICESRGLLATSHNPSHRKPRKGRDLPCMNPPKPCVLERLQNAGQAVLRPAQTDIVCGNPFGIRDLAQHQRSRGILVSELEALPVPHFAVSRSTRERPVNFATIACLHAQDKSFTKKAAWVAGGFRITGITW
jgi:hypothetical protein